MIKIRELLRLYSVITHPHPAKEQMLVCSTPIFRVIDQAYYDPQKKLLSRIKWPA